MKRQFMAFTMIAATLLLSTVASVATPAPKTAPKSTLPQKPKVVKAIPKPSQAVAVPKAEAAPEEVTYKIEIRPQNGGNGEDGGFNIVTAGLVKGRSEWAVVKVLNGNQVKILHTTRIAGIVGNSRWFDHKPIALRMCVADSFDVTDSKKNCKTVKSDTIDLPADKSLYDLSFDFRYIEGGHPYVQTIQISPDMQPEGVSKK
jgi:hypothetical protein